MRRLLKARLAVAALLAVAAAVLVSGQGRRLSSSMRRPPGRFVRGVALGLYASDPEWDYGDLVAEIAALGASDIALGVSWDEGPLGSTSIVPRPGLSPSLATLRRTLGQARAAGLRVLLFPTLHVAARRPGDWRGKIRFDDPAAAARFWQSYGAFIDTIADLAEETQAARLSVGSELLDLEEDRAAWAHLIAEVRRRYHGTILYSANWDHYGSVSFWDLVDELGVTGYFELAADAEASEEALTAAWRRRLSELGRFAAEKRRPLLLTEVGYVSVRGASRRPWDERLDASEPIDLDEQARSYRALLRALDERPQAIAGVYFWNWFGIGGANDRGYTPRGKPAAELLRHWLTR